MRTGEGCRNILCANLALEGVLVRQNPRTTLERLVSYGRPSTDLLLVVGRIVCWRMKLINPFVCSPPASFNANTTGTHERAEERSRRSSTGGAGGERKPPSPATGTSTTRRGTPPRHREPSGITAAAVGVYSPSFGENNASPALARHP